MVVFSLGLQWAGPVPPACATYPRKLGSKVSAMADGKLPTPMTNVSIGPFGVASVSFCAAIMTHGLDV